MGYIKWLGLGCFFGCLFFFFRLGLCFRLLDSSKEREQTPHRIVSRWLSGCDLHHTAILVLLHFLFVELVKETDLVPRELAGLMLTAQQSHDSSSDIAHLFGVLHVLCVDLVEVISDLI